MNNSFFKKLLIILSIIAIAVPMAGCSANGDTDSKNNSVTSPISSAENAADTESVVVEGPHASPGYIVEQYILSYHSNNAQAALECFPEAMLNDKLKDYGADSIEELSKMWKKRKSHTPEIDFAEIIDNYKSDSKYFGKPIKEVFRIPDYVDTAAQGYAILTAYTDGAAANYLCAKINHKWYLVDFNESN